MGRRKRTVERAAMAEDERVQILMDLGLTLLQAKIYLALSKTGKATIKTISKASNIARQDIYRIMPTLQKLGLAEKILAAPTMYKATPIKEGYYLLLKNKTMEHTDLQEKTISLIKNLHEGNDKTPPQEEESKWVITSSKENVWKKIDEAVIKAQMSIDAGAEWKIMRFGLFHLLLGFKKAMKRGVKIRILTEKHEYDKSEQRIIQTLKNPLFEIKYLPPTEIPFSAAIYDGQKALLWLSTDNTGVPSLWSNDPQFVKIISAYYVELWNKALDVSEPPYEQNVKQK
jgi:sugar-specific transcriptional regulator TrmB